MHELYYIDAQNNVKPVAFTNDRAMATSPIFYTRKRDAIIAAKDKIESDVQAGMDKIKEYEKELAGL